MDIEIEINYDIIEKLKKQIDEAEGSVVYPAEYAIYVELPVDFNGQLPNLDAIEGWTRRNWGELDDGLKESVLNENISENGGEHKERVAYLIAKSISIRGLEGVFYARDALHSVESQENEIVNNVEKDEVRTIKEVVWETLDMLYNESQDKLIRAGKEDTGHLLETAYVNRGEIVEE